MECNRLNILLSLNWARGRFSLVVALSMCCRFVGPSQESQAFLKTSNSQKFQKCENGTEVKWSKISRKLNVKKFKRIKRFRTVKISTTKNLQISRKTEILKT